MKKLLVIAALCFTSISAMAQLKVIEVRDDADTLVYSSLKGNIADEWLDVYKNKDGYLIKGKSTNMFDSAPTFYLGATKEQAYKTLEDISLLCDKDVASCSLVEDAMGNSFALFTSNFGSFKRKPQFVKGDRVYAKNENMAGLLCFKKTVVDEVIKYLKK